MKNNKTFVIILTILLVLIVILSVMLYSKNKTYHFSLTGDKEIVLFSNEEYIEQGFTLLDSKNNDISDKVIVEKSIVDNKIGEYEIKYYYNGKELGKRKIIVKDIEFYLNGKEEITLNYGKEYVEPGFVARDSTNHDYAANVLIKGNINVYQVGTYELKYTLVIDNYSKTLVRRINVINDTNEKENLITEIKFEESKISLKVGETKKINVTIKPSNATNDKLTWEVDNNKIVSVTDGKVKALSVGETEIRVKTTNNKVATCKVIVSKKDETVSVKKDDLISFKEIKRAVSGQEVKASVSTLSKLEPVITYYSDSLCTKKTGTPIAIGTYYIKAETKGNDIYNKASLKCSKAIIITRIPISIRVGTLNMGAYACGTGGVKCNNSNVNGFGNLFNQGKIDIVGVQEAGPTSKTTSVAKMANLSHTFFRSPASTIGVLSKYTFKSQMFKQLTSCRESREIQKVVINVNGIDISFYNTHFSYQDKCHDIHYSSAVNAIKSDPNPAIIVGDFNTTASSYYKKYFEPIGFKLAAYDNNWHNNKTNSYCDAVFVNPKGHIDIIKSESFLAYGVVSDHNFVVATISVY